MRVQGTYFFEDFFSSGKQETISPFITPASRKWGRHLPLKSAFVALLFLGLSTFCSYFPSYGALSSFSLLVAYFFAGIPSLIATIEDILGLEINIDVLMTVAAFLSVLIGSGREGALLLVLFSFSGALEEYVQYQAKGSLLALKKLMPLKTHLVLDDGTLLERHVKDIQVGNVIHVKAGEVVPLDGVVASGSSFVNLVHLTGESTPVTKKKDDEVVAGAQTLDGALTLIVKQNVQNSMLQRMIQLITQAEETKPKMMRSIDNWSRVYATVIMFSALLFTIVLPLLFPISYLGVGGSIYRSLAFLIAASPCALIIAMPIAYLSAISVAAKKGILLKGGTILDALSICQKMALDKTGTLTRGELTCVDVYPNNLKNWNVDCAKTPGLTLQPKSNSSECLGMQEELEMAIAIAAALERNVSHPIASAVVRLAQERNIKPVDIVDFQAFPGLGLQAKWGDELVFIGNKDFIFPKLLQEQGQDRLQDQPSMLKKIEEIEKEHQSYALLLFAHKLFYFKFKDLVRPEAKSTILALQNACGMDVLMLTGDHENSAHSIANELGIETFFANLRPEDKLRHIEEIAKKEPLIMVGDGVNDAPALARAHVGISMGKMGSQIAVDASDIVLLKDNIDLLPWLIQKAKKTKRIVKQNIFFAFTIIAVAAFSSLSGVIPLWLAVVLHEGGTVLVGLNALRLLKDG